MKSTFTKDKNRASFSFLDVFILLILGLFVSLLLYFVLETPSLFGEKEDYQLEVSAYLDVELSHALPVAGDTLYDQEGGEIGEILLVESQIRGSSIFCRILCTAKGEGWETGEKIAIETRDFYHDMWIYSVEKL